MVYLLEMDTYFLPLIFQLGLGSLRWIKQKAANALIWWFLLVSLMHGLSVQAVEYRMICFLFCLLLVCKSWYGTLYPQQNSNDKEVGAIESAHDGIIWDLAWHPLGHILCSGSNDHTSKFWTRNRPGDKMRDKYNLNTLPAGVLADDSMDIGALDEMFPFFKWETS